MFGKVMAPAVSKSIRMVFKRLLAPLKPPKTIKNIQKHDINENPGFFGFFGFFTGFGFTRHNRRLLGSITLYCSPVCFLV